MARYFFHFKNGAKLIHDLEEELATAQDARLQALKSARELWATRSNREGRWVLMRLSLPMNMVGSPLYRWLKRHRSGQRRGPFT